MNVIKNKGKRMDAAPLFLIGNRLGKHIPNDPYFCEPA